MTMKRKLHTYDDANELSMEITDIILNEYDPKQNQDKIEISLDKSGYSFELQDLIRDVVIKRFEIYDEFAD
tara:strand:- start:745 stop:957 length:213 start_codon:yes stop_codon:yes gene_type:complete